MISRRRKAPAAKAKPAVTIPGADVLREIKLRLDAGSFRPGALESAWRLSASEPSQAKLDRAIERAVNARLLKWGAA